MTNRNDHLQPLAIAIGENALAQHIVAVLRGSRQFAALILVRDPVDFAIPDHKARRDLGRCQRHAAVLPFGEIVRTFYLCADLGDFISGSGWQRRAQGQGAKEEYFFHY